MKITGLHNKQREITDKILKSGEKFHIIDASRQSGKSYMLSYLALIFGMLREFNNENILIVSPTYEQVRIVYDNLMNIKNVHYVVKSSMQSKPYTIYFKNNCRIVFKSADRPDTLRGGSNKLVLLDEYAYFKQDILDKIIRPTTAAKTNSKIIVASTPSGKDKFYELYNNYSSYFMHYSDNPQYDLREVEDAKMRLPTNVYNQEYEGVFIEDGGDVFDNLDNLQVIKKYNSVEYKATYAGIDWGRVNDSTVLTILNEKREVLLTKRFDTNKWEQIIIEIVKDLNQYKPIVYAESNGVGDPLVEDLNKKYKGIVKHFVMSNTSKREIIEDLRMQFVQNNFSLPTKELNPELNLQLSNYTYTITRTGTITYHHRDGFHDDYVDSLAIANNVVKKHNKQFIVY